MLTIVKDYKDLVDYFKQLKIDIEKGPLVLEKIEVKKYKTLKQNATFHKLLDLYWQSGYSSFSSYEDLRNHYKTIAGLIKFKEIINLKEETKQILKQCIEMLTLEENDKIVLKNLMNGKAQTIESWADVSKEKAQYTLNQLISDIVDSGAYAGYSPLQNLIDDLNNINQYIA